MDQLLSNGTTVRATRPAKQILTGLCALVMLLVLYGSWLPFQWRPPAHWPQLSWSQPRLGDALTNIVIYVPVSLLLYLRLTWTIRRPPLRAAVVAATAFALSSLAETGQLFIQGRVASYTDMLFNATGTVIGLALAPLTAAAVARLAHALRVGLALRPMTALFWIILTLVVSAKLAPFDFTLTSTQWANSVAGARFSPFAPPAQPSAHLLEDIVEMAGSFFAFVLLGIFGALALREDNEVPSVCVTHTIAKLAVVAIAVELLQLLICSHSCDMADALVYVAGAVLGSILGIVVLERTWHDIDHKQRVNPAGKLLLMTALVIQITLIAGYALPAEASWVQPTLHSVQWIPFYAQYQKPFAAAIGQLVSSMMWYVSLATLAAVVLHDRSWHHTFLATACITVGVVTITESLQAFSLSRYADVTEPVLALAAAVIATSAYRWILNQRLRRLPETC